jgi:hypothetical protein
MSHSLKTGAPHSRSLIKQYRNANYNLPKVLNECVDNIIKKEQCSEISITTEISRENLDKEDGYLSQITISDNYYKGFEDMDKSGVHNPMNMGHVSARHTDDDETSEYGVGLKAGSVAIADELKIYTKVPSLKKNYYVHFNFNQMMEEVDVNDSYNPKIKTITDEDFKESHPYAFGSTIIMSKIRPKAYSKTTQEDITKYLMSTLSNTYGCFLNRVSIKVNGQCVEKPYDFFQDPKCKEFTVTSKLHILGNEEGDIQYIFEMSKNNVTNENKKPRIYNKRKGDSTALSVEELDQYLHYRGYHSIYPVITNCNYPIEVSTTYTQYSDLFVGEKNDEEKEDSKENKMMPKDRTDIYKDQRLYGSKPLKQQRNGCQNYTLHKVEFNSKDIGKQLGITFNKDISIDIMKNDLVDCIKEILNLHRKNFNADSHSDRNRILCDFALKNGYITLDEEAERISLHHRKILTDINILKGQLSRMPYPDEPTIPLEVQRDTEPIIDQVDDPEIPFTPSHNDSIDPPCPELSPQSSSELEYESDNSDESIHQLIQEPSVKDRIHNVISRLQGIIRELQQDEITETQLRVYENMF